MIAVYFLFMIILLLILMIAILNQINKNIIKLYFNNEKHLCKIRDIITIK